MATEEAACNNLYVGERRKTHNVLIPSVLCHELHI